jgi:hypothetical protein
MAWGQATSGGSTSKDVMLARSDGSEARIVGQYSDELPLSFSTGSNAAFMGNRVIPLGMPSDAHFESATQVWPVASGFVYSAEASASGARGTYFISRDGQTRRYLGGDPVRGVWESWIALAAGTDPAARTLTFMRSDGSQARALTHPVADSDDITVRGSHALTRPPAATGTFHLHDLSGGSHLQEHYFSEWDQLGNSILPPAFSPDGTAVVFVTRGPNEVQNQPVLHVVELAGLRERINLPDTRGITFSPDGSHFVFYAKYGDGRALASLDAAGKVQVYAFGDVVTWLSNRRLLVTHLDRTLYGRGLYALELPN